MFQQEMARGLDQAKCCVVCIGGKTPGGWFEQEIQKALQLQVKDPSFRVMPVLLPGSKDENVTGFLELRSWIDFRKESNRDREFDRLVCGVKGVPQGRWNPENKSDKMSEEESILSKLKEWRDKNLISPEIHLKKQDEICDIYITGKIVGLRRSD